MKRIKRILILLIVICLSFAVSACKGKEKKEESDVDKQVEISSESDTTQEDEQGFTQEEVLKGEDESTDAPNASDSTVSSDSFDNVFGEQKDESTKTDGNTTTGTAGGTSGDTSGETGNQDTEKDDDSEKEEFGVSEDVDGAKYGPIQH